MTRKNDYYDWNKTLSYDAPITMVISHRGKGKTYGMRKQFINDWINHGWKFVQIARYQSSLPDIEIGYFDKVGRERRFKDYEFMIRKHIAYIRKRGEKKWAEMGRFVSATQFQTTKEATFTDVKRVLMDEAVIDSDDKYHHYLPNEVNIISKILDSATRQRYGDGTEPRLYLLGNATDIMNPYFQFAGVTGKLAHGYSWHRDKTFLIHYDYDPEYAANKRKTLAGGMASGKTLTANVDNEFSTVTDDLIASKTSNAVFLFGIHTDDYDVGVWVDDYHGLYYVNDKCPELRNTFALSLDGAPNYRVLPRLNPYTKMLYTAHCLGYVRYNLASDYAHTLDVFATLGYVVS